MTRPAHCAPAMNGPLPLPARFAELRQIPPRGWERPRTRERSRFSPGISRLSQSPKITLRKRLSENAADRRHCGKLRPHDGKAGAAIENGLSLEKSAKYGVALIVRIRY